MVLEMTIQIHRQPSSELITFELSWQDLSVEETRECYRNWLNASKSIFDRDVRIGMDFYSSYTDSSQTNGGASVVGMFFGTQTELESILSSYLSFSPLDSRMHGLWMQR